MLLSIPHYPSPHSLRWKTQLNHSPPPSSLPSSALRLKNLKPYTPHSRSSSREAAGKSAIERISEKLRSLGYLPDDPSAAASGLPPTGPGSPGEIFIPTPREIPKHRVGYTIDPSWSTPEHPVPEPGSGDTITRFRELWKRDQDSSPPAGKDVKVPTVAELMLPRKELKRLTTLGISLTKRLKVGKAGITEGIVNGIHERWRRSEVVKIRCEDISRMNMKRTHEILEVSAMSETCLLLAFLFLLFGSPTAQLNPPDVAETARWLVAKNTWGVLSTISTDLGGFPYGNVVAFSDGETGHGFGIPYFYISKLEPEGGALQNGTRVALTVSEYALGTCTVDVQDPKCKRATLSGQLLLIALDNPEVKFAQVALFTKHPGLQGFPENQNFQIYKLALEYIYVVNDFGFPKYLTPQPYLKVPPM